MLPSPTFWLGPADIETNFSYTCNPGSSHFNNALGNSRMRMRIDALQARALRECTLSDC